MWEKIFFDLILSLAFDFSEHTLVIDPTFASSVIKASLHLGNYPGIWKHILAKSRMLAKFAEESKLVFFSSKEAFYFGMFFRFAGTSSLKVHMKYHQQNPEKEEVVQIVQYTCKLCNKNFEDDTAFNTHILDVHAIQATAIQIKGEDLENIETMQVAEIM